MQPARQRRSLVINIFTEFKFSDYEITDAEHSLLPMGCRFDNDARQVINCWKSATINACPGSGKTTVLLAKLKLLSSKFPFSDGSGICVLSHTNVAVNEIKSKLSNEADKLLSYPNFVGTLQSFVDHFIVFPYLRTITKQTIHPMDNEAYANMLYTLIRTDSNYETIFKLIRAKCRKGYNKNLDEISWLCCSYLKNDCLYHDNKSVAGAKAPSAIQYRNAVENLLKEHGAIRFTDAYGYATLAINELNSEFSDLLTKRFKYVFIDEYQDCDVEQRALIDKLFPPEKCTIFKIGDVDQSIFSGFSESKLWEIYGNELPLSCSNRYGQEIADILTHLRTGKKQITSSRQKTGFKPVLIIFDDDNPSSVLPTFVSILDEKQLTDPNGVYKVIGKVKNVKGLAIGDYWEEFFSGNLRSYDNYHYYLDEINSALIKGEVYTVELTVRRLLCQVLRFIKLKDDSGNYYNSQTIKEFLKPIGRQNDYLTGILRLAQLQPNKSDLYVELQGFINKVMGCEDIFKSLPQYFFKGFKTVASNNRRNVYHDNRGRKIFFDTVHGVKGETHDVTLYVETVEYKSGDLKRVIPLFEGEETLETPIAEYARRCVYVGMSRPRKLLCVAIRGSSHQNHEKIFDSWERFDLRRKIARDT